ncbi:hypothetical protein CK203_049078 [Vitis vinifera]|uniref:Uncharacterized protein n=1 Tax=Vitis vinifera TaxID=29760 RepID=A0A438HC76_VITVI|nr:hypothetical protein CK203_049078 [Vitis vinifera]
MMPFLVEPHKTIQEIAKGLIGSLISVKVLSFILKNDIRNRVKLQSVENLGVVTEGGKMLLQQGNRLMWFLVPEGLD